MSCGQRENAHATGAWRTWPLVILPNMTYARTYLAPLWAELSGDRLVACDTCFQRVARISVGHHGKTAKWRRTIQGNRFEPLPGDALQGGLGLRAVGHQQHVGVGYSRRNVKPGEERPTIVALVNQGQPWAIPRIRR
jgi:hypothetical protein